MSGISSVLGIVKHFVQKIINYEWHFICFRHSHISIFHSKKVISMVKLSRFHALEQLNFIEAFDEFTLNLAFAKKGCSFEHLSKFSVGFLIIKHLIESS